ncbi:complex I NDUFA9 subunit family protein [Enterovirga sp.]|uniref:complex I NDUFA9 subunit family protein n=1 Tax=Enterovirga sp. TaxID=2026350 RepID=UPI0026184073|nr:complex I NDUFA9 subunit family protein [Enterovirga sp.]MDB5589647.1 3-beta hydroxysteroid dehydrogenase [Enterovirga sp.]
MDAMRQSPKLVTVFGGTGFLGRHVVRDLARSGYRIRVAVRRPNLGFFLQPLGVVGQIQLVQANLRFDESVRSAIAGADAVVNLVGILQETGRQGFHEVQAAGPRVIAEATAAGVPLVHVSALGADLTSPSVYARSKAQGEQAVLSARPDAVIVRPSLLFGQGDSFFNRFASLARALPVLPLAGADTRFQPVFVGDVAEAVAKAVDGAARGGQVYELGGPEIRTLRELVSYVLQVTERRRLLVPMPLGAARAQARLLEIVDALTLGLLPNAVKLTRDQVELLQTDNVVSDAAVAEGRTLQGLGIVPQALEAIVPGYLTRFRKTGQFDIVRAA